MNARTFRMARHYGMDCRNPEAMDGFIQANIDTYGNQS